MKEKKVAGYSFLQFENLSSFPALEHFITTRHPLLDLRKEEGRERLKRVVGKRDIFTVNQVHGAQWVVVEENSSPSSFSEVRADALLTQRKGVYLGVKVADCLPVIFFDPEKEALALLHAGWRGIIQGVHLQVAQAMRNLFSSSYHQIIVGIGPGIGKCCFSVGGEVAKFFEEKERGEKNIGRKEGEFLINLKGFLFDELVDQGFDPHKIEVAPHCTFCEKDLFYSHRREGEKTGRFMLLASLKEGR